MLREPQPALGLEQELWLLGQAPLRKFLDFADDMCAEPAALQRPALVAEWSAAARYYGELASREAGCADHLVCGVLDPAMLPLADELIDSSAYVRTFDSLPTRIAMVELAKLVVCQNHVNAAFVAALMAELGPRPDPCALFRFCLPLAHARAPVQIRALGGKRFVFRSDSTDLRFHEALLLRPEQLDGYASFGSVAGVVGLVVGYSSNCMNAVCDDDSGRLLLHNGYHRACALLQLGVTHAPCIVQTVDSRDELDLVAKPLVAADPGYFFNAPRPPLLKDFADPRLRKLLTIKKVARMIEVNFEVRDYFVEH